jgi:outer membrane biosynthesis protein TonB
VSGTAEQPAVTPRVSTAPAHSGWRAIPSHLGRARTSTLILSVLFLAIGSLYLTVRPDPTGTTTSGGGTGVEQPAEPAPMPTVEPTTPAPTTTDPEPTTDELPTPTTEPTPTDETTTEPTPTEPTPTEPTPPDTTPGIRTTPTPTTEPPAPTTGTSPAG